MKSNLDVKKPSVHQLNVCLQQNTTSLSAETWLSKTPLGFDSHEAFRKPHWSQPQKYSIRTKLLPAILAASVITP